LEINSLAFPGKIGFYEMTITSDYTSMYLIRRFEETILEEFKRGVFSGTTHTYLGQEANAVAVIGQLDPGDIVVSNHRCHGHFLAYGGDPFALFAEMMGKAGGVCGGRGGSQHLHWKNFYSNGVQGGNVPVATGMAIAERRKKSGAIVVSFLGDGTFGQGVVYESFNLAVLMGAPVLFVIENNHIAQTTPTQVNLAGSIYHRLAAFGIPCLELDTSDVMEIIPAAGQLLGEVRQLQAPRALILNTERFGPHSKGDDTRPEAYLAQIRSRRDPLTLHGTRLALQERQAIENAVNQRVSQAFRKAMESD
jgi:acetoin:2,6-dichlorophenolindophenol oxidoreductase subunit alpha